MLHCITHLQHSTRPSHIPPITASPGANEGRGADLADGTAGCQIRTECQFIILDAGSVDSGWNFKASVYNR
jgi:hypothetical protein